MPYELLGKGVERVGSVLPLTHITIWLKQIVLNDAFEKLSITDGFQQPLLEVFSALNIGFVGIDIPLSGMLVYTAVIALAALLIAGIVVKRRLRA